MDYLELLSHRKSTRRFAEGQISQDELEHILTAADNTPVGSNLHGDVHLTVVQSPDVLAMLAQAAKKRWEDRAKVKRIAGDTAVDVRKRDYDPFYGAPTVIFVSHRQQDLQPGIEYANTACVAFSMHLAATGLGLGSVLMWFALESMREIPELDNTGALGLPEGFEPLIGIALGYPVKELSARELRKGRLGVNRL